MTARTIRVFIDGLPQSGSLETLRYLGACSLPPFDPHTAPFAATGGWNLHLGSANTYVTIRGRTPPARVDEYLQSAECLVFVVDSQRTRLADTVAELARYRETLSRLGLGVATFPIVFQLNKRDLPDICSEDELKSALTWPRCTYVSTVATKGFGIEATLAAAAQLALGTRS